MMFLIFLLLKDPHITLGGFLRINRSESLSILWLLTYIVKLLQRKKKKKTCFGGTFVLIGSLTI